MEKTIFFILLILFGFILGGLYPVLLKYDDFKFYYLVICSHIFEIYWVRDWLLFLLEQNYLKWMLYTKLFYLNLYFIEIFKTFFYYLYKKFLVLKFLETSKLFYYFKKLILFFEYIIIGFVFFVAVDAIKLGT